MSDRPATRAKRFFKLAGMTASVAGNYAKTRAKAIFQDEEAAEEDRKRSHAESGARIAETLGELKGAVMKVGQMASIAQDILPSELTESLRQLQREAPPMAYEVIAEQIEKELGDVPERLFSRFEKEPFAAASIGQVHRACTDDGREVVVKVQYPGVDGAVDSDLAQLKVALRASGIVNVSKAALNESFSELRARLHEELDYTIEARQVRRFREFHEPRHDFLLIPEVIGERSAQRVLTLSYVPGDPIPRLDELDYSQEVRDELGRNLFTLMCTQVFEFGQIHADPNPGNLACRPDGKLVLYDFGCVKKLPPEIVQAYRNTIVSALAEDYEAVDEGLIELGIRRPTGPPVEDAYYKKWRDVFAQPFFEQPLFAYDESTIHDEVVKLVPGAMKRMASFQPAKDLIFLDRMVGGHYGNLRRIRSRVRSLDLLRPYLDNFDASKLSTAAVDADA